MKAIALFLTFLMAWNNLLGYGEGAFVCINGDGVELIWEIQHHNDCADSEIPFGDFDDSASKLHQITENSSSHDSCMHCEDLELENDKSLVLGNLLKHLKNQMIEVSTYMGLLLSFKNVSFVSICALRGPAESSCSSILNTSTVVLRVWFFTQFHRISSWP